MMHPLHEGLLFVCSLATALGATTAPARQPDAAVVIGESWEMKPETTPHAGPLKSPFGVGFDSAGNMFIVELAGGRVHRLDRQGRLRTIAGNGSQGYAGDGGPASEATFNGMHNIAVTPAGDLYISDSWNHCVRKIDAKSGRISTVAGTGQPGFSGDKGPARKAQFNYVMCVSLSPALDKLYLADLKNLRIRMVDLATGIVSTVAGNGEKGVPEDGAIAIASPLVDPRAVAVDASDNVYVLERGGHALRVVTSDGRIRTVAGTGKRGGKSGPALEAELASPKHLAIDRQGRVLIADDVNAAIRRYDPGTKTLVDILGKKMDKSQRILSHPHGVCVCGDGQIFVVDTGHHRILRLRPFD